METAGCRGWGKGDGKADSQFLEVAKNFFPFSENNMSRTHKTEFQLELSVKYAIYMIVTRCCSTPFTPSGWAPPTLSLCLYTALCCGYIHVPVWRNGVCVSVCVCACPNPHFQCLTDIASEGCIATFLVSVHSVQAPFSGHLHVLSPVVPSSFFQ